MGNRESFKSSLGFILVSAGCAIGIGNVWKFPYVAGANGGGVFVLFYLLFPLLYALAKKSDGKYYLIILFIYIF